MQEAYPIETISDSNNAAAYRSLAVGTYSSIIIYVLQKKNPLWLIKSMSVQYGNWQYSKLLKTSTYVYILHTTTKCSYSSNFKSTRKIFFFVTD